MLHWAPARHVRRAGDSSCFDQGALHPLTYLGGHCGSVREGVTTHVNRNKTGFVQVPNCPLGNLPNTRAASNYAEDYLFGSGFEVLVFGSFVFLSVVHRPEPGPHTY